MLVGYAAELARLPANYPFEVVTMTRQTTAHGQQPLLATVRALYAEGGVGRFYTGVSAYLGLAWKPALQQAIFERARRHWLRRGEGGGGGESGGGESGESRLGVRAEVAAAAWCAQI